MKNEILIELIMWYPFFLWWGFYGMLRFMPFLAKNQRNRVSVRFRNRIPQIQAKWAGFCLVLSLFWRLIYQCGFRYEAQVYMEAVIPAIFALPLIRANIKNLITAAVVLVPVLLMVCAEQIKCVQFGQWYYSLDGNRYLLWAREHGSVLERLFWFGGPDFPVIELFFYPAYIIMTAAVSLLAMEVFPVSWKTPRPGMSWFFPAVFGAPAVVLFAGIVLFVAQRRDTLPFHAVAAFMPILLLWIFFLESGAVRDLCRTKMFAAGSLFSFANTCVFEWYHSSLQRHWVYNPENGLASLHPWLSFRFPNLPVVDGRPVSWPLEEFCAYPALYVFVMLYLVFFHSRLGLEIFSIRFSRENGLTWFHR